MVVSSTTKTEKKLRFQCQGRSWNSSFNESEASKWELFQEEVLKPFGIDVKIWELPLFMKGFETKGLSLNEIIETTGFHSDEIAFMGDDLPDLPIMRKVGLSIAVADAHESVIEEADMVTLAQRRKWAL
jgi:hypothetical protein